MPMYIANHLHNLVVGLAFAWSISTGPRKVGPLGLCRLGVWDHGVNQLFITWHGMEWAEVQTEELLVPGYYRDFLGLLWVPSEKGLQNPFDEHFLGEYTEYTDWDFRCCSIE